MTAKVRDIVIYGASQEDGGVIVSGDTITKLRAVFYGVKPDGQLYTRLLRFTDLDRQKGTAPDHLWDEPSSPVNLPLYTARIARAVHHVMHDRYMFNTLGTAGRRILDLEDHK